MYLVECGAEGAVETGGVDRIEWRVESNGVLSEFQMSVSEGQKSETESWRSECPLTDPS